MAMEGSPSSTNGLPRTPNTSSEQLNRHFHFEFAKTDSSWAFHRRAHSTICAAPLKTRMSLTAVTSQRTGGSWSSRPPGTPVLTPPPCTRNCEGGFVFIGWGDVCVSGLESYDMSVLLLHCSSVISLVISITDYVRLSVNYYYG